MIWYSRLLQNFLQLIVIHTVKGFGIVNKAEIDAFLELSCFFDDPADVGNLSPQPSAEYPSGARISSATIYLPGLLRPTRALSGRLSRPSRGTSA